MTSRLRVLLAAFGDPGHTFPVVAVAIELARHGHDVTVETWEKWKSAIEAEGLRFAPAPEYRVFAAEDRGTEAYEAAVRATYQTRQLVRELAVDLVVSDVITIAPALAAELEGVPWATLVPHLFPYNRPGLPPYGLGASPPSTALGRAGWRLLARPIERSVELGSRQLNRARAELGLGPLPYSYGGLSRTLSLVATFPGLEYTGPLPSWAKIVGPCLWSPPGPAVCVPAGREPLVLVTPSTAQDPTQRLLRTALLGLSSAPVRVLATVSGRHRGEIETPDNATLTSWLSYETVMPEADLIICHGGHGTLAQALACGVPVLVVPAAGDMAENAARVRWCGAGRTLPWRLLTPATLRWVTRHMLVTPSYRAKASVFHQWAQRNDGPAAAVQALGTVMSGGRAD